MNITKSRAFFLAIGVGAIIFIWFSIPSPLSTASDPTEKVAAVKKRGENISVKAQTEETALINKSQQDIKKLDITKPFAVNGKSYIALTAGEVSVLRTWMSDRGYLRLSDLSVYEGYSEATLLELAKRGDLKALDTLSSIATDKGEREKAIMFINLGVVYGSIAALERLTIYPAPRIDSDATEEQRRPAALETLAVTEVIAMRGDKHLSRITYDNFISGYKQLYDTELDLTQDEKIFVASRAQEIYENFQNLRHAQGLGDFDNSEPSGVKKFFGWK